MEKGGKYGGELNHGMTKHLPKVNTGKYLTYFVIKEIRNGEEVDGLLWLAPSFP